MTVLAEPTVPTGAPPAPDPISSPAPVVPPSQPVSIPPSSTVMPDETDWRAKYDGTRGAFKQAKSQWDEQRGAIEQGSKGLQQQLEVTTSQLTQAQEQVVVLTAQIEAIPQLTERANQADRIEALNARLELIMRYPNIVSQTELVETVVGEGDEATTQVERSNPVLDLLLSSSLQGEEYALLVAQMNAKFTAPPAATPLPTGSLLVGPGPPTPVSGGGIEDLQRQVLEARENGDHDLVTELTNQMAEWRDQQE